MDFKEENSNGKYWIIKTDPKLHDGSGGNGIESQLASGKQKIRKHNLGFLFAHDDLLMGVYFLEKKNGHYAYHPVRLFQNPIHRRHLTRHGLAAIRSRAVHLAPDEILSLDEREFKKLLDILKQINRPKSPPLLIFTQKSEKKLQFLVRTNESSPDLRFDLKRNLESLHRAGMHLLELKQKLHDSSGNALAFQENFAELKNNTRALTSSLFDARSEWIALLNRNIFMSGTSHGLFPWELLTAQDRIISLERNFCRAQNWKADIFLSDRAERKKSEPSLLFLDCIQNQSSLREWQEIRQILGLFPNIRAEYMQVEALDDIVSRVKDFSLVHIAGHGEIIRGKLCLSLNGRHLPLEPGEFFMPLPVLMVAHICSPVSSQIIENPSFPAHHFLVPDIFIKEGSQNSFFRTLYMKIFNNQNFGVAVRLARYSAMLENDDPFAFVYYGNGDFSWDYYRLFNRKNRSGQ